MAIKEGKEMSKYRSPHQRYINATAKISDVLLSSQVPERHNHLTKPEQKLCSAVFYDAIFCIERIIYLHIPPPMKRTVDNYGKRRTWDIAREAYHWLLHEEGLITSEQACFAAGIDIEYARDHIKRFVKKQGKLEFFQGNGKH